MTLSFLRGAMPWALCASLFWGLSAAAQAPEAASAPADKAKAPAHAAKSKAPSATQRNAKGMAQSTAQNTAKNTAIGTAKNATSASKVDAAAAAAATAALLPRASALPIASVGPTPAPAAPLPLAKVDTKADAPTAIHTGTMRCELGQWVIVTPDPQQPTHFVLQTKTNTYHMSPVVTTTGVMRLEDAQASTVWLQLPAKSMLMNSKLGRRLADDCQSPEQRDTARAMKQTPTAGLLDGPNLAKK